MTAFDEIFFQNTGKFKALYRCECWTEFEQRWNWTEIGKRIDLPSDA